MTSMIPGEPPAARPGPPSAPKAAPGPSRLLTAIYHDIGMAAVATGLDLSSELLDGEARESVKRGSRYIFLMPKRQDLPQGLPRDLPKIGPQAAE
jgi:hypothetical protein